MVAYGCATISQALHQKGADLAPPSVRFGVCVSQLGASLSSNAGSTQPCSTNGVAWEATRLSRVDQDATCAALTVRFTFVSFITGKF